MDFVSPILEIAACLCTCTSKHAAYIVHLEDNHSSLTEAMKDLMVKYNDVKTRVQQHEEPAQQQVRTGEVKIWLEKVEAMETEVNEVLQKGAEEIEKKCLGGCCSKNCCSSYKVGKMMEKKLHEVTELKNNGRFTFMTHRLSRGPVDERLKTEIVGLDHMLVKVWEFLEDENVGIGNVRIFFLFFVCTFFFVLCMKLRWIISYNTEFRVY